VVAVRKGTRVAVVISMAIVSCLTLAGLATAAPNPPGNNGTIKVDDLPFDDAPNNEPHVGCSFQIDFYGFDQGDLFADVTFESHPPTGPVQVLLTDEVFIGEDDNAGGGSQAGLDASKTYTLDFTGIQPHPNQGFHVKLTIHADGSQGADTKHKVFWVTGCAAGTTTTTSGTTTTSRATGSSGATSTSGTTTTTTRSGVAPTSQQPSSSSGVGGGSSSASGGSGGGNLPFTGANALSLLLAGLVLLGLGAGMMVGKARQSRP
jgi:hypothetical protein